MTGFDAKEDLLIYLQGARGHDEVTALLGGLDVAEPGVVQATRWRPDRETDVESQMWCGVARKDEGRA
jgi:S-adenosyl methyltransferase